MWFPLPLSQPGLTMQKLWTTLGYILGGLGIVGTLVYGYISMQMMFPSKPDLSNELHTEEWEIRSMTFMKDGHDLKKSSKSGRLAKGESIHFEILKDGRWTQTDEVPTDVPFRIRLQCVQRLK